MIKEVRCATWEAFKEELGNLKCEREKKENESDGDVVHPWLYRGQADCKWELCTSLERKSCKNKSCKKWYLPEYGKLILSIYSKIETTTGRKFKLPTLQKYKEWACNRHGPPYFKDPNDEYGTTGRTTKDCLKYLIYLRHHGFPSPLLDWTACPYIAAYFAFEHDKQPDAEHAAIFAYLGWAGKGKSSNGSESSIEPIGHDVIGDERHSAQKSWYTVAFQKHNGDEFEHYSSYEDAFGITGGQPSTGVGETQDFLRKFIIPIGVRPNVLNELCERNITQERLRITQESLPNAHERLLRCLWEKRSTYLA